MGSGLVTSLSLIQGVLSIVHCISKLKERSNPNERAVEINKGGEEQELTL
jgi:hypothetical protein